jgi:hypothetical protein
MALCVELIRESSRVKDANVLSLRFAIFGFLCAASAVGCSNVPAELTKKTEVVTWPALQALRSPEIGMGIFRSAQMGDQATLKTTLNDPKVEDLVKKFEEEPIPKQFATKAREDMKSQIVTEYKLLISGGKSGAPFADLKKTAESLTQKLDKLSDPALK